MEKFNLIVLVCCHENKETIRDLVDNIHKFNYNTCVILNNGSPEDLSDLITHNTHVVERKVDFQRFDTMVPLHIELNDYMTEKNLVSDYVLMMSSNQLFIKHDIQQFMSNFTGSYYDRDVDHGCIGSLDRNEVFRKYHEELGDNFKRQSNHDGMFFAYPVFREMMEYFSDFRGTKIDYHAEEFLYVAYLMKFCNDLTTFDTYSYWQPNWRHTHDSISVSEVKECIDKNLYLVKRVTRETNNDARIYIRGLK